MKILIRSVVSGNYLAGSGGWTSELQKAKNFPRTRLAIDAAANLNTSELEILLLFDDPLPKTPLLLTTMKLPKKPKAFAKMLGVELDEERLRRNRREMVAVVVSPS